MVTAVAWVDILGFASLVERDRKRAQQLLSDLRELVATNLRSADESVEVYGVNDGFFATSQGKAQLLIGLATLYRAWFDRHSQERGGRPLLRGAVSVPMRETRAALEIVYASG